MGNQAALSGLSDVPQGSLFGAGAAVTVCKLISTERCMVLSDASIVIGAYAGLYTARAFFFYPRAFSFLLGGSYGRI